MATSKVIKNVPLHSVVKILGPGTATIDLSTLKTSVQDFDRGNARVNISSMYFSSNSALTVSRNSNTILKLSADSENWIFNAASGFVLDEDNDSNVTVTFMGGDGTVIIGLSKIAGYTPNVALGADGVQPFTSGN